MNIKGNFNYIVSVIFEFNPKCALSPQYKLKINNSTDAIWITMEIMKYV